MVSTYTDNLRITKQGDNDNPNTWGQVVNNQVITLLEEAVTGVVDIDCSGSTDINLATSVNNGATDTARHAVLELTGTIGADIDVILPAVEKVYIVRADFSGDFTITVIPSGGAEGIDFTTGKIALLYTNGTSIYEFAPEGALLITNNLSDLSNTSSARTNLGLGTMATQAASAVAITGGTLSAVAITGGTLTDAEITNGTFVNPSGIFPSGVITEFAGTAAPAGWLFCYGQAVSRTTYADLFSALGTTYGSGDGSTTFNIPDLRGRVTAGKDNMGGSSANRLTNQSGGLNGDTLGATGGSETHTLTTAQMPAHTHTINATANRSLNSGGGTIASSLGVSSYNTGSTGGGGAHNNVQPTIILNKIIKT